VPEDCTFNLAHVAVANWSHARAVRFVQLRCENVTGRIAVTDHDGLLD
jgi:hypothetical protein